MATAKTSLTSTSKFLSLVLRHQPEVVGMQLDPEGWMAIDELIQNAELRGKHLTLELLHEVVASCEKKRFTLSDDGLKIRANQGHSVPGVELNLEPVPPPSLLYHGTSEFSIRESCRNAIRIAREQGFSSIAFPLIGAGKQSDELTAFQQWPWVGTFDGAFVEVK